MIDECIGEQMEGEGAGQGVGDGGWTRWTIVDRTCTRSELRKASVTWFIVTERICLPDYYLQSSNSIVDIIVPKLLIEFGTRPKITNGFWGFVPNFLIDFGTRPKFTNGFWDYSPKFTN